MKYIISSKKQKEKEEQLLNSHQNHDRIQPFKYIH
jgi:hypothetical protein